MTKKILVAIAAIVLILVLIGVFYSVIQDKEPIITGSSNTAILSLDTTILKIDKDTIIVLEGTLQADILDNIGSEDNTPQIYRITTSEGSNKTKSEIYEYDRLYIMAENGVTESYYMILFTHSLD